MKPVEIEFLIKNLTKKSLDEISSDVGRVGKDGKESAGTVSAEFQKLQQQSRVLKDVISGLEAKVSELRAMEAGGPDMDQKDNIASIEALEAKIKELQLQLKQLEETAESVKVVPPEMQQAKSQYNGLHMSIQQIAREMPSLAMGPQMFFLAISNNLPVFTDELARARKEYDELVKAGKKGTPVWKQVLGSLFSWQTALTTGIMLLVMYGDEIIDWTKSLFGAKNGVDALTKAMQEKNEVEKEAHAISIRTRTELDNTLREIKDFTGTKEQEKAKVDELNQKYGDAFGTYKTLSEWYDVLIQKGNAYVSSLFMQAKAQSYIQKAVEADEKANDIRSKGKEEYRPFWGAGGKAYMFFGGGNKNQYGSDPAEVAFENAIKEAEDRKQFYLDQAEWFQKEYSRIIKESGLSDYRPIVPDPNKKGRKEHVLGQRQLDDELQELRRRNEQEDINLLKDGSEKRIAQIRLNYRNEIDELKVQEKRWRDAQKGRLTGEQSAALKDAYALADDKMKAGVREVEQEEVEKGRKKLNALLDEYRTFDQKRRDIDERYKEDMDVFNSELARLQTDGSDTSEVEASISARTERYKSEIKSLEGDILRSSDFYNRLFADASEKGYKVLKDFYSQARSTLDNTMIAGDGVTLSVPAKDGNGNFVKKQVTVTVAEFERMQKRVKAIQKDLEKENPFKAFQTSFSELISAVKQDGDVSGALKKLNANGKELTSTIRGWGDSLGSVFGERFSRSIGEIMTLVDGVMDMGTGIGELFSGNIVGGISGIIGGLSSVISMFTSWKEKMEEMKREWYIAEIETSRAIRERNEELAVNRDTIQDIIQDQETLNWLVENGYSKPASISVWEAQSSALEEYKKNLDAEMRANDALWNSLQNSDAHWEWGNSMNGGSVTHSLRGMSAEQIELYYNQNKLSDAARDYYEAWVESGKTIDELKQKIEETYASLQEMVMGTSFDGFLENVKSALASAKGDVSSFADFTEETIAEALLNSFMYKDLAKAIEPLYNELSEHMIDGTADKTYLENWKSRFQQAMEAANARLDEIAETTGIDIYAGGGGTTQTGRSGGFEAMTQEQGTKLEGLFTSGQIHWASMDESLEDVSENMGSAVDSLKRIEENTEYCRHLEGMSEDIKRIVRDGIKVK
nr:MAG TPA: tail tape measure protein [Bacteriophage sp.]